MGEELKKITEPSVFFICSSILVPRSGRDDGDEQGWADASQKLYGAQVEAGPPGGWRRAVRTWSPRVHSAGTETKGMTATYKEGRGDGDMTPEQGCGALIHKTGTLHARTARPKVAAMAIHKGTG